MNASIAVAFDKLPQSKALAPGILPTISATKSVASWSSLQIRMSLSSGCSRLPNSCAGTCCNVAATFESGNDDCTGECYDDSVFDEILTLDFIANSTLGYDRDDAYITFGKGWP